jgi:hypothetical protein
VNTGLFVEVGWFDVDNGGCFIALSYHDPTNVASGSCTQVPRYQIEVGILPTFASSAAVTEWGRILNAR